MIRTRFGEKVAYVKTIENGELYTEKRDINRWHQMLDQRPQDAPILMGEMDLQPMGFPIRQVLNKHAMYFWYIIADIMDKRFDWERDSIVFRTPDHWKSFFAEAQEWKMGDQQLEGDCEDLALTCLEWMIYGNINPDNLYILLCLNIGGQSVNRRLPKDKRMPLNHCVAAFKDEHGVFHFIDSDKKEEVLDHFDSKIQVYIHHCMGDDHDDWYYSELVV
jgi:hypothetical protein